MRFAKKPFAARNFAISICLLAGLALGTAHAQTKPKITSLPGPVPENVLWVGSSFFYYNNGMASYVGHLVAGAPAAEVHHYNSTMVTISGSGFDWHDMESYFRPHAIGYYNFDSKNNIVFNDRKKLWDATITMDCSQCPIHPVLKKIFTEYARSDAETIRRHGAAPIFFMSWAYADKPEMTEKLAEAYTTAGNANNALVIPAGLAFARVVKERPDLNLYQPDKRHPTLMGTYLAASTVYAALYHRSPEENSYTAGLPTDVAKYLRATAWRTVQDYYGAAAE
jgi:hypothetical protein